MTPWTGKKMSLKAYPVLLSLPGMPFLAFASTAASHYHAIKLHIWLEAGHQGSVSPLGDSTLALVRSSAEGSAKGCCPELFGACFAFAD